MHVDMRQTLSEINVDGLYTQRRIISRRREVDLKEL